MGEDEYVTRYILRRILFSIPVLLAIVFFAFLIVKMQPGGPFVYRAASQMPENLRDFQWVDIFEADGLSRLVMAIKAGIE